MVDPFFLISSLAEAQAQHPLGCVLDPLSASLCDSNCHSDACAAVGGQVGLMIAALRHCQPRPPPCSVHRQPGPGPATLAPLQVSSGAAVNEPGTVQLLARVRCRVVSSRVFRPQTHQEEVLSGVGPRKVRRRKKDPAAKGASDAHWIGCERLARNAQEHSGARAASWPASKLVAEALPASQTGVLAPCSGAQHAHAPPLPPSRLRIARAGGPIVSALPCRPVPQSSTQGSRPSRSAAPQLGSLGCAASLPHPPAHPPPRIHPHLPPRRPPSFSPQPQHGISHLFRFFLDAFPSHRWPPSLDSAPRRPRLSATHRSHITSIEARWRALRLRQTKGHRHAGPARTRKRCLDDQGSLRRSGIDWNRNPERRTSQSPTRDRFWHTTCRFGRQQSFGLLTNRPFLFFLAASASARTFA